MTLENPIEVGPGQIYPETEGVIFYRSGPVTEQGKKEAADRY